MNNPYTTYLGLFILWSTHFVDVPRLFMVTLGPDHEPLVFTLGWIHQLPCNQTIAKAKQPFTVRWTMIGQTMIRIDRPKGWCGRIHVWIFTYIYHKKSTIHVGKYTSHMDPMGKLSIEWNEISHLFSRQVFYRLSSWSQRISWSCTVDGSSHPANPVEIPCWDWSHIHTVHGSQLENHRLKSIFGRLGYLSSQEGIWNIRCWSSICFTSIPILRKWFQLTHIFQMGWNHQLEPVEIHMLPSWDFVQV